MNSKYPIFVGHMLTNTRTGEHTVWTYYSDGTMEETKAYLSPALLLPMPFNIWGI